MRVSGCAVMAVTVILRQWVVCPFRIPDGAKGSPLPCGSASYEPSWQCCCNDAITDIPQCDRNCCGGRGHEKLPDATRCCRGVLFHTASQLCCGDEVVYAPPPYICCGSTVINTRTYKCCAGQTPYHESTMECDFVSETTSLRVRQRFEAGLVCDRNLPVFNVTMPTPHVTNHSHTHIRGEALSGNVSIKHGKQIIVPLSSVAIVGRHPDCLHPSHSMELVFNLKNSIQECRINQTDLQRYFRDQVLDVFVKKRVKCGKTPKRALLRLKDGHNAVVFMAGPMTDLMAWSMQKP